MKKMRKMRLFQKDSYIGIDFLDKKTEVIRMKSDNDQDDIFSFDIDTPQGVRNIAVENPEVVNVNAIKAELTAFRDAILHDSPTLVSEMDGYQAMEVAHQILEKIGKNRVSKTGS
jgi:hypothetical protein